ncbi:MAG: hypothetical protein PHH14_00445 [Candidatus Margulisbacteria bacterium]|nr:hypothetical protein [Candidatus Margulisiibacteriota bacterium]
MTMNIKLMAIQLKKQPVKVLGPGKISLCPNPEICKVPVIRVERDEWFDNRSCEEVIAAKLKKLGVKAKESLLFRAIPKERIQTVLIHGTDQPKFRTIYATPNLLADRSQDSAIHYAFDLAEPVIAVYKNLPEDLNNTYYLDQKHPTKGLLALFVIE